MYSRHGGGDKHAVGLFYLKHLKGRDSVVDVSVAGKIA